jgi:glutathione S-transferase
MPGEWPPPGNPWPGAWRGFGLCRSFFAADRYTVADIALFAYTQSAGDVGYQVPGPVRAWMDRVRAQPSFFPIRPPR